MTDLGGGYPNDFAPNGMPATWPTYDEQQAWNNKDAPNGQDLTDLPVAAQLALDAAIYWIAARCCLEVRPVDTKGDIAAGCDQGVPIPPTVKLAVLMQAKRWYRRKDTPDGGTLGASELGGVVRQARLDSDVEALIANELIWGLA